MSVSNDMGRALEYVLTQFISRGYPKARLCGDTKAQQKRDRLKFCALSKKKQSYFKENCDFYVSSLLPKCLDLKKGESVVSIARLKDSHGVKGDPTDIRLTLSSDRLYNISLKHNHDAVKHQRPGALCKQLGIVDKNKTDAYRSDIKNIEKSFINEVRGILSLVEGREYLFSDVKSTNVEMILSLYKRVCERVVSEINANTDLANNYFRFIVGTCCFDKVIVNENSIRVLRFYMVDEPVSMSASIGKNGYVEVSFSNGFLFSMRLHTASSRFKLGSTLSLKFDTRMIKGAIPEISKRL